MNFELILQFYQDLIGRKTSRPLGEDLQFLLEMYCRGLCVYDSKMGPYRNERLTGENCQRSWWKLCLQDWLLYLMS